MCAGDRLIDGRAEIRADGVPPRPRARQQRRASRVVAAGFVCCRRRLGHVEAADEHDAVAERLERLGDEREREVLPLLERTPVAGRRAVRVPDADEPLRRRGCGQPQRPQGRHHRFEQRQGEGDAGAAEKRPSGNVLLGDEHDAVPQVPLTRMRNCALRTTPSTIAENRLPFLSMSRAMARTVGMSVYSSPRPSA